MRPKGNFTQEDALRALFLPHETIGFSQCKDELGRSWHKPGPRSVYFCLNPLKKAYVGLTDDNIAEMRNLLVEFDETKIPSQRATIKRLQVPYNTLTYSGGKSLQAVISLSEPCSSVDEYKYLFRMLVAVIPHMDRKVGTISRLARLPNAVRENGALQTLIDVTDRKLTIAELKNWAYNANCIAYNNFVWEEKIEAERPKDPRPVRDPSELPPYAFTVQQLLEGKTTKGSRHDALMGACTWLYKEGYSLEHVEQYAYEAQAALAMDRDDVPGIMRWLARNIS